MLNEFKEFAIRGNVVDMAVGIIIGAAFGAIISSLVADVVMPPVGLMLGGVDFSNLYAVLREGTPPGPYAALADAKKAGAVTVNYGTFLNALLNFLVVAFSVFLLVRVVNMWKRQKEEAPAAVPSREEIILGEIRDLLKTTTR